MAEPSLKGKIAIVSGSSSGIGAEIGRELASMPEIGRELASRGANV